jgi:WD40 repeat protein
MSWAVTIKTSGGRGTGSVISPRLVLTCWHVVEDAPHALVLAAGAEPRRFTVIDHDRERDLALLALDDAASELDDDLVVIPRAYWRGARPERGLLQLSIEEADLPSSVKVVLPPAPPSAQHVELKVPAAREGVEYSYSGAPVLEMPSGWRTPRLLGIVRARDPLSADAGGRAGKGWLVPIERIAECFDQVAELVETPVERDAAWLQHWEPRSRGVATHEVPGSFFSGRDRAFERVRAHLESGSGLLVVTGERGCGKSALLARTVTLACPRYLALLETNREGLARLRDGAARLDAAVLARGQSSEWVAEQIALQLGCGSCDSGELAMCVNDRGAVSSIVLDAVDECEDPRALMRDVVIRLAHAGARIAIAALRPRFALAQEVSWVDLSGSEYGDDAVPEYVTRRLCAGRYSRPAALVVAREVGTRAKKNFLYAELVARRLTQREPLDTDAPVWRNALPSDLTEAFKDYLERFGDQNERVLALLHPLAYARGDGLTVDPPDVWLATANELRPDTLDPFEHADLRRAADQAGDYLISEAEGGARRLYHQGLGDTIVRLCATERLLPTAEPITNDAITRQANAASRHFTDALVKLLPDDPMAPVQAYVSRAPYLRAHLASHLADDGRVMELLDRPGLLLSCDADALRKALVRGALSVPTHREPARLAVVHALAHAHPTRQERAIAMSVALRRQGELRSADALRLSLYANERRRLPYELISGPPLVSVLSTIPGVHTGRITALVEQEHDSQPLIVTAGDDGAVRSWRLDGTPGPLTRDDAHTAAPRAGADPGRTTALAVLEHCGQPLIVSAGYRAVRSWWLDGSPGPLARHDAHNSEVTSLAVVEYDAQPLILSSDGQELRSWWLDGSCGPVAKNLSASALLVIEHDGEPLIVGGHADGGVSSWRLDGSSGSLAGSVGGRITALAVAKHACESLIISAGADGAVRSWRLDGSRGPLTRDDAHRGWVWALEVVEHEGQPLIVSAGDDAVRSWRLDGTPGLLVRDDAHSRGVRALTIVKQPGKPLIVSGGNDGELRSWWADGATGRAVDRKPHSRGVRALTIVKQPGKPLIVSGGNDGELRSWRLNGTQGPLARDDAHTDAVRTLAVVEIDQPLILSAGADGAVLSWGLDGAPGPLAQNDAHKGRATAVAVVKPPGELLVVSAGDDGRVRSWQLDGAPGPLARDDAHTHGVTALAVVEHAGQPLIVSAGGDGAIRSWRLDGAPGSLARDDAHTHGVTALAVVEHAGQPLIVSAGANGAVRSWRPDGTPGPLGYDDTRSITALAVLEHDGQLLAITAGYRAVNSWWLDRRSGPLARDDAHGDWVTALTVVEHDGESLILSAGADGTIVQHTLCSSHC